MSQKKMSDTWKSEVFSGENTETSHSTKKAEKSDIHAELRERISRMSKVEYHLEREALKRESKLTFKTLDAIHLETVKATNERNKAKQKASTFRHAQSRVEKFSQLPKVEAYFDESANKYLYRNDSNNWIARNQEQFCRRLSQMGYLKGHSPEEPLSEVHAVLHRVESDCGIHASGPLAGYKEGLRTFGPLRYLVTESPTLMNPTKGEWPTIRRWHEEFSGVGKDLHYGALQRDYLCYYTKRSAESLRASSSDSFSPMLIMFGPSGCGKTFWQDHCFTPLLGGRSANPWEYFIGREKFNAELFKAEHLRISDPPQHANGRNAREILTDICKNTIANSHQRLRAMWKNADTDIPVFWRPTITANPERINCHPIIDNSTKDKMISLWCHETSVFPQAKASQQEKDAFLKIWNEELPHFLHYLMNEWTPPAEICTSRGVGIKGWQHPEILLRLEAVDKEALLLDLADKALWDSGPWTNGLPSDKFTSYKCSPVDLTAVLQDKDSPVRNMAIQLLGPGECTNLLRRLVDKYPDRVAYQKSQPPKRYTIYPQKDDPQEPSQRE